MQPSGTEVNRCHSSSIVFGIFRGTGVAYVAVGISVHVPVGVRSGLALFAGGMCVSNVDATGTCFLGDSRRPSL